MSIFSNCKTPLKHCFCLRTHASISRCLRTIAEPRLRLMPFADCRILSIAYLGQCCLFYSWDDCTSTKAILLKVSLEFLFPWLFVYRLTSMMVFGEGFSFYCHQLSFQALWSRAFFCGTHLIIFIFCHNCMGKISPLIISACQITIGERSVENCRVRCLCGE